jgi:hypothetical protein
MRVFTEAFRSIGRDFCDEIISKLRSERSGDMHQKAGVEKVWKKV